MNTSLVIPRDFIPCAESAHELYQIQLSDYEGPLDLLLFLIKRHELDIFNIPIGFICERYREYLDIIEQVNIDVASEFMFMAAELALIKSKMLLPKPPAGSEADQEETDPRAELVARLLEYQKYKIAAEHVQQLPRMAWDTFERPPEPLHELPPELDAERKPLHEVSVFSLVRMFDGMLKRQKPELKHQVVIEQVSLRKRMYVLIDLLQNNTHAVRFEDALPPFCRKIDLIITFLAVLELTRLKLLSILESEGGHLYLKAKFQHADDAFAHIEGVSEAEYNGAQTHEP